GSVADTSLWNDACQNDLRIPEGRYLLADAGFRSCDALLVSYRGVCYQPEGVASSRCCVSPFNSLSCISD
ncbi:hypothetical protein CY34DRAFT_95525, partial [Suillus luteus UH-Slu-Lm8-n1]